MDDALRDELCQLALSCGFDVSKGYASAEDMRKGIREIGDLPLGQSLSDLQRNALMENLARVIRITCVSGQAASIHQQAQLRRFTFLPAECPEGAGAYRAILLRLRVELPHWMT